MKWEKKHDRLRESPALPLGFLEQASKHAPLSSRNSRDSNGVTELAGHSSESSLLEDPVITGMAGRVNKTPAQVF